MTKTTRNSTPAWALITLLVSAPLLQSFAATPAQAAEVQTRTQRRHHAQSFQEGVEIVDSTGRIVVSINAARLFNPASNTKLATTLFVLDHLGADYRFQTEVRTNGTVNADGHLQGDLFVDGHYLLFGDRQAQDLVRLLNDRGITSVSGNLYVSSDFTMNLRTVGVMAASKLMSILDAQHKQARLRGRRSVAPLAAGTPHVSIAGKLIIGSPTGQTTLIASHNSPPLKDILKVMLCYSDNTMAERFGAMFGGPAAIRQFLVDSVGIAPAEVRLGSASGLGTNRFTPRAMMQVLQALQAKLATQNLVLSDLLAVAGIDDGTMKKRLDEAGEAGSVIAKTGTLPQTDSGVSTLSGAVSTTGDGTYLFVIFEMHGDVLGFRARQDKMLADFQTAHGGALPLPYTPILPRVDGEDFWN